MNRLFFCAALVAPAVLTAAGNPWPASKATLALLAGEPDAAVVKALRTEADAAFDRRDFAAAVSLRRLEAITQVQVNQPMPAGLRAWLLENRANAEEFASLFSDRDDLAAVSRILGEIWTADEKGFRKYPALACAIALVYDRPCPMDFPHSQVSPEALPRKFQPPVEVFRYFRESADANKLLQSPAKLAIDELAFVVPVLAPLDELKQAQAMRVSRGDIPKLYPSIVYDKARFANRTYQWPGESYSLDTIRRKGGICVDQAYYTMTMAQALGVPAFILSGAGNDGYHAFTGYLERPGKWRTDVGRYANQKYATGTAWNPLTWTELTDHDIEFLEARFRNTPNYAAVELHVVRAAEVLKAGDKALAERLLLAAKGMEPRCPEVWAALAMLAEARGDAPLRRQSLYAEAAKALGRYRELEILWRGELAKSLEADGKTDAALAERLIIVRRNAGVRPELAVQLAVQIMDGVLGAKDTKRAISVFNKLAAQFDDAGPEFYRNVVARVVQELNRQGLKADAVKLVRTLNQKYKPGSAGSQLAEIQTKMMAYAESGSSEPANLH